MVSIADISRIKKLIKISELAKTIGLPVQTLNTKIKQKKELTVGEANSIELALKEFGIQIINKVDVKNKTNWMDELNIIEATDLPKGKINREYIYED